MALSQGKRPTFDFLRQKREIISVTAARTLTTDESGALVSFNVAAGVTVTLPAGAENGTFYDFFVETTVTSVADKVITAAGTELLVGSIINCDTDTSDTVAIWKALVASSYISINLDGSTKGGIKGDSFRLTKINSTTWHATGVTNGTGTVATPFATS